MTLRTGAIAACFALLLVAGIAFVVIGDPSDDLATEALEPQPTTTVVTTTTQVVAVAPTTEGAAPARQAVAGDEPVEALLALGDLMALVERIPTTTTTTTTTAPTTTAAPAGPAPVRIPRPSCAAGLGALVSQTAPFTGLSASIPSGLPAVVVKVSNNNSASRRALIGLDQADIVFEERIEYSATRWAAVFHSRLPANVGPVRSGRTTDIQILQNLGSPVLGYSGSNPGVARQFADASANGWFTPFVNTDRAPFARDGRYRAPDNLFVDPTSLGACGSGGTPRSIFSYGPASSTTAQPASSVSLDARSPYSFSWDAGSATWRRSQSGTAHTTREGIRLAPKNVVVLFVSYVQSSIDASSVDARTVGSGAAWIFRDGTNTVGSWSRPGARDGYSLTDGAGNPVTLAAGQTWVVLAPTGSATWG